MLRINDKINNLRGIGPYYETKLKDLGIITIRDLLFYFPFRYQDFTNIKNIADLVANEQATIIAHITKIKSYRTFKKHMLLITATVEDESGSIEVLWFNQPFIIKTLKQGTTVSLSGKVKQQGKKLLLESPAYELVSQDDDFNIQDLRHTGRLVPIYSETAGISSKMIRSYIKRALKIFLDKIPESLPLETRQNYNLMDIKNALSQIHFPDSQELANEARRRFVFEEMLLVQIHLLNLKHRLSQFRAPKIPKDINAIKEFISYLPFKLTNAQRKAIWEMIQDIETGIPMNRLLEGDVGSGKTVVAISIAYLCLKNGFQVAFMAPTEVLVKQHFQTIKQLLKPFDIKIACLTSDGVEIKDGFLEGKVSKEYLLKSIAINTPWLVVGTHSLIQKDVQFGNLGFVIIDEQHRFGVAQRSLLLRGSTQITEQINAKTASTNTKQKTDLPYKELTNKIKGVIFDVFNKLGSGLQKPVYQEALTKEWSKQNISFDNAKSLNVVYNNKKIGLYKPDFIIENKIILVITSHSFSDKTEEKQILSYLKESGFKLAVLVNFNNDNVEIKYVVYDLACDLKNIDTNQRIYSPELAFYPHLLSMTATPIPRTLALAMYGDLELSILDEMPKGRQSIITKLVSKRSEDKMYDFIRKQIIEGRQAFIICPRIEDTSTRKAPTQISTQTSISNLYYDDKSNPKDKTQSQLLIHKPNIFSPSQMLDYEVKAVKKEYERIKKIFPEFQIEMIHGKMKPKEKDDIMRKFYDNKIQILIATSVIEVGIDVPNATIMVIEGAEHFGLSQLHQFRGRVGRGEYQSYCFLFTESYSKTTRERLKAMLQYSDGFKLAEIDLHLRGPGEFFGVNQSGFPDLAMQALSDTKQLAQIHEEATRLINKDNTLQSWPNLWQRYQEFLEKFHME